MAENIQANKHSLGRRVKKCRIRSFEIQNKKWDVYRKKQHYYFTRAAEGTRMRWLIFLPLCRWDRCCWTKGRDMMLSQGRTRNCDTGLDNRPRKKGRWERNERREVKKTKNRERWRKLLSVTGKIKGAQKNNNPLEKKKYCYSKGGAIKA